MAYPDDPAKPVPQRNEGGEVIPDQPAPVVPQRPALDPKYEQFARDYGYNNALVRQKRDQFLADYGKIDAFGPTAGYQPPEEIAPDVQLQHERAVAQYNADLAKQAEGYMRQGLDLFQSYRPGGAAALASGQYQGLANTVLAGRTQPLDLLFNYRRNEAKKARSRQNTAGLIQGGATLVGGIVGGAIGGPVGAGIGGGLGNLAGGYAGKQISPNTADTNQPGPSTNASMDLPPTQAEGSVGSITEQQAAQQDSGAWSVSPEQSQQWQSDMGGGVQTAGPQAAGPPGPRPGSRPSGQASQPGTKRLGVLGGGPPSSGQMGMNTGAVADHLASKGVNVTEMYANDYANNRLGFAQTMHARLDVLMGSGFTEDLYGGQHPTSE